MTVRLCVFGNSHAAALREAWLRQPGRWPGLSLGFLAAQGDHLLHTAVQDGRLVPTDCAGQQAFERISGAAQITFADYDGFVIAGASVCVNAILPIYRDSRWSALPSVAAAKDPGRLTQALVSNNAARAVMRSALQTRLGYIFAARLRPHITQPIFLTSQPRVSDEILTSPRPVTRLHNIAIDQGDSEFLGQEFDRLATAELANLDCRFIPQPAQTISRGMLTRRDYVKGANRLAALLDVPQPKSDILHANGLYGALVLDQIVAATLQL